MNEIEPTQQQDSGFRKCGRYLAGVVVGAVIYFAGKEIGISDPLDLLAGALGAVATNSAISHYQIRQDQEYPPHRRLDI